MNRQSNDFYPTDSDLALAITSRVAMLVPPPTGLVEPSAGTGTFIRAARQVWPTTQIVGVDIDPRMRPFMQAAGADHVLTGNWVDIAQMGFIPGVLGLGNPPFSVAQAHIEAGMGGPQPLTYMAMLLRMSFMGSHERVPFWDRFPAKFAFTLVPRPNFMKGMVDPETGKKKTGDNSEYAVYVWKAGHQDETLWLQPLVWRPKRKKH